jgi:hypothetical protein
MVVSDRQEHVRDVFLAVDSGRHVVRRKGKAEAARSPRAGVVIIVEGVHVSLPRQVLPLVLEFCLNGLQVHDLASGLPSPKGRPHSYGDSSSVA